MNAVCLIIILLKKTAAAWFKTSESVCPYLRYILVTHNMLLFLDTAGYNHLEVAEYLLEQGADVNAQDKGGLIPLHNASSYGVRD